MNPSRLTGPIIFDCETGPIPESELNKMAPEFKAPSNYKDEEKIARSITEQREAWVRNAALSPISGEVLAIGLLRSDKFQCLGDKGEPESVIIDNFWNCFEVELCSFAGFNVKSFDLPFLIRRSFKLGIPIPYSVREGRYFSHRFIDLMDSWTLGDRRDAISLDELAKFLGVGAKTGTGAAFAGLWAASKEAGRDYLLNDLKLTKAVYSRLHGPPRKPQPMKDDDQVPL